MSLMLEQPIMHIDNVPVGPLDDAAGAPSSIAKAVRVLRALALAGDAAGVTQIAHEADLPKSTTHRVLAELIGAGLVSRSLTELARQPLAALFERTSATVHFGVLEEDQVLYLDKLTARGGTRIPTRVGARMPAVCTALGKSMLAFAEPATKRKILSAPLPCISNRSIVSPAILLRQLHQIQLRGVAFDLEESQLGVCCVAAPIFHGEKVIAAVSVSRVGVATSLRSDEADVRRAAREIQAWLETES
jgi:DNA-binding IclR family transcriptional regulator